MTTLTQEKAQEIVVATHPDKSATPDFSVRGKTGANVYMARWLTFNKDESLREFGFSDKDVLFIYGVATGTLGTMVESPRPKVDEDIVRVETEFKESLLRNGFLRNLDEIAEMKAWARFKPEELVRMKNNA